MEIPVSTLSPEQQAALAARTALNRWVRSRPLVGPRGGQCQPPGQEDRFQRERCLVEQLTALPFMQPYLHLRLGNGGGLKGMPFHSARIFR